MAASRACAASLPVSLSAPHGRLALICLSHERGTKRAQAREPDVDVLDWSGPRAIPHVEVCTRITRAGPGLHVEANDLLGKQSWREWGFGLGRLQLALVGDLSQALGRAVTAAQVLWTVRGVVVTVPGAPSITDT
eukprot:scaffold51579_cov64-Phaeocystis_antarctica.AAC.3